MKRLHSSLSSKAALQKKTEVCLPRHTKKWQRQNNTGSLSLQRQREYPPALYPKHPPFSRDMWKLKDLGQLFQWLIPTLDYRELSRSSMLNNIKKIRMHVLHPRKGSSVSCILPLTVAESKFTVKIYILYIYMYIKKKKKVAIFPLNIILTPSSFWLTKFLRCRWSLCIWWPLVAFSFISLINFDLI